MNKSLNSRIAHRWAKKFSKQKATAVAKTLAPSLLALSLATAAHAQGTIDFTQATTTFTTIKTFVVAVGALFVVMGLIFAAVRMMGGRMAEGAMGIVAALIGGLVIGLGPGWINSLSGQVTQ